MLAGARLTQFLALRRHPTVEKKKKKKKGNPSEGKKKKTTLWQLSPIWPRLLADCQSVSCSDQSAADAADIKGQQSWRDGE